MRRFQTPKIDNFIDDILMATETQSAVFGGSKRPTCQCFCRVHGGGIPGSSSRARRAETGRRENATDPRCQPALHQETDPIVLGTSRLLLTIRSQLCSDRASADRQDQKEPSCNSGVDRLACVQNAANYELPFVLRTDVSNFGLGGCSKIRDRDYKRLLAPARN